jgi:hypothetical protein
MKPLWRPTAALYYSLTGLVGQPFAPRLGGNDPHPRDASTLSMEPPDSPVSDVLLHW